MRDRLVKAIQLMLYDRFDKRLARLLKTGDELEATGSTCTTAHLTGYREGYFEAIEDLAEAGLLRYPGVVEPSILEPTETGWVH